MSAESDYRSVLLAHPPLVAMVGGPANVAQNGVGPSVQPPYISFTAEHQLEHNLIGEVVDDEVTFTTSCWGKTPTQADELAGLVIQALLSAPAERMAIVVSQASSFDPDLGLDATVLIVEWTAT